MTCLLDKYCHFKSENCDCNSCSYFMSEYSQFIHLPEDFKPLKEKHLKEKPAKKSISDLLSDYWELET